jgi:hypothetical protein
MTANIWNLEPGNVDDVNETWLARKSQPFNGKT